MIFRPVPHSWREEFIELRQRALDHMETCEKQREEDKQLQDFRHAENSRRLDKQDDLLVKASSELQLFRKEQSAQFAKVLWTVIGGFFTVMVTIGGGLLSYFLIHVQKL